jgi:hypothetical protein
MPTEEKVLSSKTLRTLKKGQLVKHSGMLCIVLRFLKRTRIGIYLRGPDDKEFLVRRHKLANKEALLSQARAEFKASQRGLRETPDFLFFSAHR